MLIFKQFDGDSITWNRYLQNFDEHTIYQSYEWGTYKSNFGWNVIRLIGSSKEKEFLAQILYRKVFYGSYIIWIPSGILGELTIWSSNIITYLKSLLRAKFIYIRTSLVPGPSQILENNLHINGWSKIPSNYVTNKTLIYNLSNPEAIRIKIASGNWRHNLRRSFKKNLKAEHWKNPDINQILKIYESMQLFKNIKKQFTYKQIKLLVDLFDDNFIVVKCVDENGELISVRGSLLLGERAWDVVAATSTAGRKIYASHHTFWTLMEICHSRGVKYYDMGGVDPINNKGVYDFKKGTGATEVTHLGNFDYSNSDLFKAVIRFYAKLKLG